MLRVVGDVFSYEFYASSSIQANLVASNFAGACLGDMMWRVLGNILCDLEPKGHGSYTVFSCKCCIFL